MLAAGLVFGLGAGVRNGEDRVRFEAGQAAKVCQQMRDMRFNELSSAAIQLGAPENEQRFFDCTDMKKVSQDTYWDDATKSVYFDTVFSGPDR